MLTLENTLEIKPITVHFLILTLLIMPKYECLYGYMYAHMHVSVLGGHKM